MLELKLNHISERGPWCQDINNFFQYTDFPYTMNQRYY